LEVIITETGIENNKDKRTRDVSLTFRVTAEERELIERRMAQSGIKNFRAYLLKQATLGRVIHIELDSVKEMVRLLSNATNSMNQITKRVNGTGNLYEQDVADLAARYDELWGQTKEILRRLSAI
jgi:uncharacterized protein (DUF1778 family)